MSLFFREFACYEVEQYADSWAVRYVRPTFDGDPDAALSLCCALSKEKRGAVAVALWQAKIPRPVFQAFLASVWDGDHRQVIAAAQTRRRLAAMFRYAAFPLSDEVPERVRVWRGTSVLTLAEARAGYSWTTSRDVACWFAMRSAARNGSPLVLAAEVCRADIALYHHERGEHEAVLMKQPVGVSIDGNAGDWEERFGVHEGRIRAANSALNTAA